MSNKSFFLAMGLGAFIGGAAGSAFKSSVAEAMVEPPLPTRAWSLGETSVYRFHDVDTNAICYVTDSAITCSQKR